MVYFMENANKMDDWRGTIRKLQRWSWTRTADLNQMLQSPSPAAGIPNFRATSHVIQFLQDTQKYPMLFLFSHVMLNPMKWSHCGYKASSVSQEPLPCPHTHCWTCWDSPGSSLDAGEKLKSLWKPCFILFPLGRSIVPLRESEDL